MNKLSVFHHRPCRNAEALQVIYTNAYTTGMLGSASKTVNGVVHDYYYVGDRLQYEKFGTREMWFFYDADGNPSGFKYQNGSTVYNYYYVCNWHGDVVALYANDGLKYTYEYDVWGKMLAIRNVSGEDVTGAANIANYNPLRYRGYYYDSETGLYYVSSRYYDSEIGRWINTDNAISRTGKSVQGYNLFIYCFNNPVNMIDPTGNWPKWFEKAASAVTKVVKKAVSVVVNTVKSAISSISKQSPNVVRAKSLPATGKPGSSQTLPNPDGTPKQKRWYGPDGNAERDRDYNHPGNMPFPHDHEWKNGSRQPDHLPPDPSYKFSFDSVLGVGLVVTCAVGIVLVTADDTTGVGIADDWLFGPLGDGVGEGLIMIFG